MGVHSLDIVHGCNCFLGSVLRSIPDETKASAAARIAVLHNNLQSKTRVSELTSCGQERDVSLVVNRGTV